MPINAAPSNKTYTGVLPDTIAGNVEVPGMKSDDMSYRFPLFDSRRSVTTV